MASLPEFAFKMRNYTGVVDEGGSNVTITNNWLIDDFIVTEIKQLGVVQRNVGIRPKLFNGLLPIPTFDEFLSEVHHIAHGLNKSVGEFKGIQKLLMGELCFVSMFQMVTRKHFQALLSK